jgi:hypothetical protein
VIGEPGPGPQNPLAWLLNAALMLLGATIALTLALQLLAHIWMWLVGIAALVGLVIGGVQLHRRRSTKW